MAQILNPMDVELASWPKCTYCTYMSKTQTKSLSCVDPPHVHAEASVVTDESFLTGPECLSVSSSCALLALLVGLKQDGLQSTALFNSVVDAYGKVQSQAF